MLCGKEREKLDGGLAGSGSTGRPDAGKSVLKPGGSGMWTSTAKCGIMTHVSFPPSRL